MIPVKVDQLFLSNMGFVVLLKGTDDERSLPIFIGAAEAQAIATEVSGAPKPPRPLTHDLLKNMLDYMECRLLKVEVSDLKDSTFYAKIHLDRDGTVMQMDSRPSDAIALALRYSAPIFVANNIMDSAGQVFDTSAQEPQPQGKDKKDDGPKKELTPLESLREKLKRAVEEERYEDAAKARDEIERLKHTHTDN